MTRDGRQGGTRAAVGRTTGRPRSGAGGGPAAGACRRQRSRASSARSNTAAARVVCHTPRATMPAAATTDSALSHDRPAKRVPRSPRPPARRPAPAPATTPATLGRRRAPTRSRQRPSRVLFDEHPHVQPSPAADREAQIAIGVPAVVQVHDAEPDATRAARRRAPSAARCARPTTRSRTTARRQPPSSRADGRCSRRTTERDASTVRRVDALAAARLVRRRPHAADAGPRIRASGCTRCSHAIIAR